MFCLGGSCRGDAPSLPGAGENITSNSSRATEDRMPNAHLSTLAEIPSSSSAILPVRRRRHGSRRLMTPSTMEEKEEQDYTQVWAIFDRLREESRFCDVILTGGGGTARYPVHKAVLAANSQYFRHLFTGHVIDNGAVGEPCEPELVTGEEETTSHTHTSPGHITSMEDNTILQEYNLTSREDMVTSPVKHLTSQVEEMTTQEQTSLQDNIASSEVSMMSPKKMAPSQNSIVSADHHIILTEVTKPKVEVDKDLVEIPLAIDAHTLGLVVDYMYKRRLGRMSLETIETLLVFAGQLSMTGLQQHCRQLLLQCIQCDNCLSILHHSQSNQEPEIEAAAWHYLLKNFRTVVESSLDFLNMSAKDLLHLAADDYLNVRQENEVCRAIMRWVDFRCSEREQHMPALLQCMRLGLVSADFFIDHISSHHSVCRNLECEPRIREAWEFLYNQQRYGNMPVDFSHPLMRPRVPNQVMFVIGGWSGGSPVSYTETYDVHADRWYAHPDMEDAHPRAYHALVSLEGLIYMLGGFDGTQYHSSVRRLNPVTCTWTDVAPMYSQRCYVSATTANNKIYACGGYDGRWRMKSAECYDPSCNQWCRLANMTRRRSDAGCDTLNGLVYVIGGFDGDHCLSSAERYDPSTNQWTLLPRLSAPRSGVAVRSIHGSLLAVGGFDGHSRLVSGEKYCPITRSWSPVANMYLARSNCTCAVLDDQLFVVGGYNGNMTIGDVECYNDETDEWLDVTDMNVGRSALSACVLSDLPNARKFTHHGNKDSLND